MTIKLNMIFQPLAIEAGCTGYITKPINPDTFISNLEQYLSKQYLERDGKNEKNSGC